MLFTSLPFVILVLITLVIYYLPPLRSLQVLVLTAASFLFYSWEAPILVFLLIVSILINVITSYKIATGKKSSQRFWAIMGVLMVPLDALHVVTGVLSYRSPELFGVQAFWVLPLFACAGLALGMGHRHSAVPLATRFFAATVRPTTTWAALGGLGALLLAYASSGALQGTPIIALFGYVALWSIVVWRVDADARPALILHSLGAAIVGPLVEMAISSTGAFTHAHNDIFGVPLWLPGIYLNAAAASHLLDRRLLRA